MVSYCVTHINGQSPLMGKWPKWWILQQAMFDYHTVCPFMAHKIEDSTYPSCTQTEYTPFIPRHKFDVEWGVSRILSPTKVTTSIFMWLDNS